MLIWIRRKNAVVETASLGGDVIELPFCLFCGGRGSAMLGCKVCKGEGIDVELASVKRALAAAAAEKAANAAKAAAATAAATSTASTGSTPASAGGGAAPTPANPPQTTKPSPSAASNAAPSASGGQIVATNLQGEAKLGDRNSAGTGPINWLGYEPGFLPEPTARLSADDFRRLLGDLAGSSPQIKAAAQQLYKTAPDPDFQAEIVRRLAEGLKHRDWTVRVECVRTLQTWHAPGLASALALAARDESWVVREFACYSILQIGDVKNLGPLLEKIGYGPDAPRENPTFKQFVPQRERALAVRCLIAFGPAAREEVDMVRQTGNYHAQCAAEEILRAYGDAK
jgi:hypothetical protein